MVRIAAVFLALFLGAVACLSLLPSPAVVSQPQSAVATRLHTEAQAAVASREVRVVYPPSDASASVSVPSAAVPEVSNPLARTAEASPASAAPAQTPGTMPANDAVQAGAQSLNINTASVEALNNLAGVGHVGRTIAQHRPYRSVEDLLTKRVLRKAVYDKIRSQIAAE